MSCEYIQPSIFFEPLSLSIYSLFISAWLSFGVKIPTARKARHFRLKVDISGSEPEFDANVASLKFKICPRNSASTRSKFFFLCLSLTDIQTFLSFFFYKRSP